MVTKIAWLSSFALVAACGSQSSPTTREDAVVGRRWGNGIWRNGHWSQIRCATDVDCFQAVAAPLGDPLAMCSEETFACDLTGETEVQCGGLRNNLACAVEQRCVLYDGAGLCFDR